jgi:ABC-2 type transport system permease protein
MMDLEYRANFIGSVLMTMFEIIWSALSTLMFFTYTDNLGGWTYHETLIVVGLLFAVFGLLDAVLWANLESLAQHVKKGTFDFIMAKPVNSQFHSTLQRVRLDRFANLVGGIGLIIYALSQLGATPTFEQWVLFLFLFAGGMLFLYALFTVLGTLAFWTTETRGFLEVIYGLSEMGRVPVAALPEPMRAILTFVLPIAFVTTVPAEMLLGKASSAFVLYGWIFALALFAFSIWFWRIALRRYGSAA